MECIVIPKLFPYGEFLRSMKLTRGKLIETLRRKNDGWTTYQVRKIAGVRNEMLYVQQNNKHDYSQRLQYQVILRNH